MRWMWVLSAMLLFVVALTPRQQATAAAIVTFELSPPQPAAGQPADLLVQVWAPAPHGGPDLSQPLDMTGYPFDIRVYRSDELPAGFAPPTLGFPLPIEQIDRLMWRGTVIFLEAGSWVIVFRNWYPPLTTTPPSSAASVMLQVNVTPAADARSPGGATNRNELSPSNVGRCDDLTSSP